MLTNTPIFLLGLAVGTSLLLIGLMLGYWFGRKSVPAESVVDKLQFLDFLRDLSKWTTEFSGDVTKYQTQLTSISEQVAGNGTAPKEEILGLLSKIMQANQQLQERLDSAEQKLDSQTDQISNYLTEARTDGLTGLMNRRAFDKATDELFAQWRNKDQSFTLGLIDIDHFKKINDTYGHPAGDAVLQHVSARLSQDLSDAYCVARYGGEEFAVLATASLAETANELERIRQSIEQIEVNHDGQIISVSLSAGAAEIAGDDKIGKLVRRSDEALYAAKLGGRNRVYIHDGTICRLITKITAEREMEDKAVSSENDQRAELAQSRLQERLKRIVEEESRRVVER